MYELCADVLSQRKLNEYKRFLQTKKENLEQKFKDRIKRNDEAFCEVADGYFRTSIVDVLS